MSSLRRSIGARALFMLFVTLFATAAQASGGEHKSQADLLRETGWQTFNLIVILALLIYFGRKPVADYFASRRHGIQSQLSQAADLLSQAEHRNSELQRKLVDLGAELDSIREASTRRAEEEAMRILAEARATADRIRRDAQAAIDQELRRAQSKLRDEAADLALELASRKLESGVTDSDRDRLMDEFITRVEPNAAGDVAR
jgi:F-type H+-transporting ATPase subunit b